MTQLLAALAARVGAAGGTLSKPAGAILQAGSSLVGTITSPLTGPISRESTYAANRIGPTLVPEKDALLKLWWSGSIPADVMRQGLLNHGVSWTAEGTDETRWPSAWWNLVELERPMFTMDDYRRWRRQGRITDEFFLDAMARHGFADETVVGPDYGRNLRNAELFRFDWINLPPELALELWRRGAISQLEAEQCLKVHGYKDDDVRRLLTDFDVALGVPTLFALRNRDEINDAHFDELLRREGLRTPEDRQLIKALREEIPGPSDLVTFALREAWDPAVVARFGYDQEFPAEFNEWMQKQGFHGDARTAQQIQQGVPPTTWAQMYWRVHWQNLSPSLAFQMYHRLRPGRIDHFGPDFAGMRPFTFGDLESVLKINDYPAPLRRQIAAVNSSVLTRVDIRRLFDLEIIDRVEVKEQYLDRGYTPDDAEAITKYTEQQRRISRAGKFTRRTKASVIDAYNVGVLTRTATAIALYELQFTDPDKLAAFRALPQGTREQRAIGDQGVQFELTNTDAERSLANGKIVVKTVRNLYVKAHIDDNEANTRLAAAGIAGPRIAEYLLVWTIERMGPRKILTTKQIQSALAHGIIPVRVATFRLRLLGYTPYDTNVILAEAQRSIALEQAKAQQAAARTLKQQQAAQQAQLKALAAEKKRVQNELARYAAPSELVKWYALDYIDGRTLETRLKVILEDPTKISAYIDAARDARQKRLAGAGKVT